MGEESKVRIGYCNLVRRWVLRMFGKPLPKDCPFRGRESRCVWGPACEHFERKQVTRWILKVLRKAHGDGVERKQKRS